MLSFKQKIFITYVVIYVILIALMFPFGAHTVRRIVNMGMEDRAEEMIQKIKAAKDDDAMIRLLKEQKSLIFFRISVITDEYKVLYDSHTKRLLGPQFSQENVVNHPEVVDAFEDGVGYSEGYSELLGQKFSYMAKSFDFHGKTYVLRTAFPYKYLIQLTHDFEIGFFVVSSVVLLLFGLMTWLMINRLTAPINRIIEAVRPYQEGIVDTIPTIQSLNPNQKDEFGKLAQTLSSLSEKIQRQIDSVTQERNEKEAVLEALIEGIIAVDRTMVITYANKTALHFLKQDNKTLVGHVFDESLQKTCQKLLLECQTEKTILNETIKIKSDNGKLYLNVVAIPQQNNSGAILILQDQSALYKMLDMRKDFIANASHELKTPITIIRGFAEMLHEHPELSPEIRGEVTEKIVRNCLRMTTLVKDLLTLSDVENIPESRLVDCDIVAVIDNCATILRDAFPDASIAVQHPVKGPLIIKADPYLMEMAFLNLIENGIKYSKPPAEITVTFETTIPDKLLIKIADKGIGIPDADIEHIFERFYTVSKAHSQKMGGSGLGLSIVENIILKHQGTIRLESQVGVGTTFFIKFPI